MVAIKGSSGGHKTQISHLIHDFDYIYIWCNIYAPVTDEALYSFKYKESQQVTAATGNNNNNNNNNKTCHII